MKKMNSYELWDKELIVDKRPIIQMSVKKYIIQNYSRLIKETV